GADLVEVDLLQGHPVRGRLGLGQAAEDAQGEVALALAQPAAPEDLLDVGQVAVGVLLGGVDVDLRGGEAALAHLGDVEAAGPAEGVEAPADGFGIDAGIEEGGQRHVAADAAEAVEMQSAHDPSLQSRGILSRRLRLTKASRGRPPSRRWPAGWQSGRGSL